MENKNNAAGVTTVNAIPNLRAQVQGKFIIYQYYVSKSF